MLSADTVKMQVTASSGKFFLCNWKRYKGVEKACRQCGLHAGKTRRVQQKRSRKMKKRWQNQVKKKPTSKVQNGKNPRRGGRRAMEGLNGGFVSEALRVEMKGEKSRRARGGRNFEKKQKMGCAAAEKAFSKSRKEKLAMAVRPWGYKAQMREGEDKQKQQRGSPLAPSVPCL
ncbi:hypothetical protein L7F22_066688 [Adiantum nelumboides]|nr:hypothetical protein [Adiantum nelumboides]